MHFKSIFHSKQLKTYFFLSLMLYLLFFPKVDFGWAKDNRASKESNRDNLKEFSNDFYLPDSTLRELVQTGISENPGLKATYSRWQAALQKAPQVKSLPDPKLKYTGLIKSVETRVGPQNHIISLSQKFPWFGKLSLAEQAAIERANAIEASYQIQLRALVQQIKNIYYELFFIKRVLKINWEEQELLQNYERIASTRYSIGVGIQQNVIKVQTELTKLITKEIQLKERQRILNEMLGKLLNRSNQEQIISIPDFKVPDIALNLESLLEIALTHRYELVRISHNIKAGDLALELAKKVYYPDFTLGLTYIQIGERGDQMGEENPPEDNGKDAFSVMAGINIPLWLGKRNAQVKEAKYKLISSRQTYRDIKNQVLYSVEKLYAEILSIKEQYELFQTSLIPQAKQALNSSEAAYMSGKVSFLELLDSDRMLLKIKITYERLIADYMKALANMEYAIGRPFPELEK